MRVRAKTNGIEIRLPNQRVNLYLSGNLNQKYNFSSAYDYENDLAVYTRNKVATNGIPFLMPIAVVVVRENIVERTETILYSSGAKKDVELIKQHFNLGD